VPTRAFLHTKKKHVGTIHRNFKDFGPLAVQTRLMFHLCCFRLVELLWQKILVTANVAYSNITKCHLEYFLPMSLAAGFLLRRHVFDLGSVHVKLVTSSLRHCATSRKVASSIPDGVVRFFSLT